MTALLTCTDLHAWYGSLHALKGVSVSFAERERIAVFGHNGSGKSTLFKCCVGSLATRTGAIEFAGQAVTPGAVHRNVQLGMGFVPQDRNVFRDLSVERNLRIAGLKRRNDDLAPIWELFPVLRSRRNQDAGTMSGGEQQMVALGMALMTQPKMLLLDEPTTGLAPALAKNVLETVERISLSLGIAILIIEQNVPRTLAIADRAIIMKGGRVLSDGPAQALLGKQDLWNWF
ncbi:MAG TPA: ABC transporter ATP-binding protein [Burkholderiales bacterium]|jgi:branched-chain amino acid transport system ATP-binding protein|nr:ABC transporter ATP-binding protein [Burkholderiales bacterium]